MAEISAELLSCLAEEGTDVLAAYIGETASENSLVYQSLFYVLSKGIEFVLPTLLSASFGDPTAFTLGLIRRDISKIQKDLDYFREIPFHQIKYLIEEVENDCDDEENHFDAYEKFKVIERKSIEAIFTSKNFQHKIKAAEIAILAKSYIKRFNHETRVFDELHTLEDAKKKSLAAQMLKLLTEFVQMPEYLEAAENAKDAWYRMKFKRMENHSIVDQVDSLKISVYTNSVLCLPTIQESKLYLNNGEPVLVKSWNLFKNWIPEGERQALETSLTKEDLHSLFGTLDTDGMDEFGEFNWIFNECSPEEEDVEDTNDSSSSCDEDISDVEDILELPHYFIDNSEDENLSDDEDEVDEDELELEDGRPTSCRQVSMFEETTVEVLGSRFDPFRVYMDLNGVVYIKAGLQCKLYVNGEVLEESSVVQNAWKIDEPNEKLRLEFLVCPDNLRSLRTLAIRKLNLTEELGTELIDTLAGSSGSCNQRAVQCLHSGTISVVQVIA